MVQHNNIKISRVMVELKNVSFGYNPNKNVIEDLSFNLEEGRFYGLLGKNGTGKTTLMKIISGILFSKEGYVNIEGNNPRDRKLETLQEIFMMPADFTFPKMSLEKYVSLYSSFYPKFNNDILDDCLDNFEINKNIKSIDKLSLGEKHKIAVSLAISFGTKLILFDEAANGMDIPTRKMFRKMLMKHISEDQTVVLSTHVVQDIENLLTDIIVLRKGQKTFISSLDDIRNKYSFGIQSNEEGAIYSEPCAEGYRVICNNTNNDDTEVSLELLFNALTKEGGIL